MAREVIAATDSGRISIQVNTQEEQVLSYVDRLHGRLLQYPNNDGDIDALEFALELRNLYSGRRGVLMYISTGMSPMAACRGVATCRWQDDYRRVYIPRRWMNRMLLPYVERSIANNGTPLSSSAYSFHPIVDGDRAILIRCLTLSYNTVQAVEVYGWDDASIGVHPNFCDYLKLDFDGDEVHVLVVSSDAAVSELDMYASRAQRLRISIIMSPKSISSVAETELAQRYNMFIGSTRSVCALTPWEVPDSVHKQCGNKSAPWLKMTAAMELDTADVASFMANSVLAMDNLINSHRHISEGHVYQRQLRYSAFQVMSTQNVLQSHWALGAAHSAAMSLPPTVTCESGYPVVRLASRVSNELTQLLLDMAKRAISSRSKSSLAFSVLVQRHYKVLAYSSREGVKDIVNLPERSQKCLLVPQYAWEMLGVS
ncbi:hypothetical protein BDK51DRAFT_52514 [Blyttiomyces helicus]|uniref:Uncharacterized protein n=1 Tax=Blyttiomyces helicus TaxID=388810 RepID=A0A4P9WHN3_9FUNG|nr:hypothetical protein BDK51DRAFT_52514 [Blyttiomyces helicus]|eukprot:RKO91902.1 hypothetical protein BDK51DRAFT_52514 [Blyttiomyces helicus]